MGGGGEEGVTGSPIRIRFPLGLVLEGIKHCKGLGDVPYGYDVFFFARGLFHIFMHLRNIHKSTFLLRLVRVSFARAIAPKFTTPFGNLSNSINTTPFTLWRAVNDKIPLIG